MPVGQMDLHDQQPIFFDCVICHGRKLRSRRSKGARTCKHDSCKRGLKRKNTEPDNGPMCERTADAPTQCYRIDEALGVSLCALSTLSGYETRAGREEKDDEDICCLVRGGRR